MRRLAVLGATFALIVSGCSDSDDRTGGPEEPDPHNEADETYVEVVRGQLGWTAQIADLAADRSGSPDVEELAAEIAQETDDLREPFDDLFEEWDIPEVIYSLRGILPPPRMEPDPDFLELQDATGAEFDRLWVDVMTEQVESTISSTEKVLENGENSELRGLAEEVADVHDDWLEELEEL